MLARSKPVPWHQKPYIAYSVLIHVSRMGAGHAEDQRCDPKVVVVGIVLLPVSIRGVNYRGVNAIISNI